MNQEPLLIRQFHSILLVQDPGGRLTSYHSRYASCFIMTLKGKIRFTFGEKAFVSDAAHGLFIPKGARYINHCLEDAESILINFDTLSPLPEPRALDLPEEKTLRRFYQDILQLSQLPGEQARCYLLGELYRLAGSLLPAQEARSHKEALAETAYGILQREYGDPDLQIEQVARRCLVSPVYLRRIFRQAYHKLPYQMLTQIRMEKARIMVLEKRPIKEIAFAVGYGDLYQFSRAYKRFFGHPPTRE